LKGSSSKTEEIIIAKIVELFALHVSSLHKRYVKFLIVMLHISFCYYSMQCCHWG